MAELRIDYDGIASTKSALEGQKEEFDDLYQRMANTINELPTYWSGSSAQGYVDQFAELKPSFDNISGLIGDLALQLNSISQNFESADNEMASQLGIG